ncbi:hypothetical protein SNOG_11398 [Parastagonospora nodorum SN15]|uniref:Uncharacterized protein n=1 Tax=Phaeosphaeria nodorum (strain SN15 / ATCC MYA-4574 / FGSC 10173) TaxID=321614 RepID=Q0UA16_PHANO|nr:hypothetical protein SNOG_11398 [Parastagonospora nodorum SN15]EAT81106.1 hypothetical protein SNOG_11398 [Parastagonospora nodorum SN15]
MPTSNIGGQIEYPSHGDHARFAALSDGLHEDEACLTPGAGRSLRSYV